LARTSSHRVPFSRPSAVHEFKQGSGQTSICLQRRQGQCRTGPFLPHELHQGQVSTGEVKPVPGTARSRWPLRRIDFYDHLGHGTPRVQAIALRPRFRRDSTPTFWSNLSPLTGQAASCSTPVQGLFFSRSTSTSPPPPHPPRPFFCNRGQPLLKLPWGCAAIPCLGI